MNEYYIIPDILELKQTTDPERQNILRRRIAANVGDREALMQILGISGLDPDSFYPDQMPPELSTADTIDAFLGKFGSNLPDEPTDTEELMPLAPAVDYLTLLEMEQEEKPIERSAPPVARVARPEIPEETPDLTESFAKVLIKNGNYSRACEILEQLHLKNPEKSIYFADQMRFLRKLIALKNLDKNPSD